MKQSTILLIILSLFWISAICKTHSSGDRILLSDIDVLTFKSGKYTSDYAYPQMVCKGPYCSKHNNDYNVNSIQCTNKGFDGKDVGWHCKSVVKNNNDKYTYTIKDFQVVCKGYDYPEDPYILYGSCNVEYVMDRTINQYNTNTNSNSNTQTHTHTHTEYIDMDYYYDDSFNDPFIAIIFIAIFLMIFIVGTGFVPMYRVVHVSGKSRRAYPWNTTYYTTPFVRSVRTVNTTNTGFTGGLQGVGREGSVDVKVEGFSNTRKR